VFGGTELARDGKHFAVEQSPNCVHGQPHTLAEFGDP
jgi:hypothetical protein